MSVAIGQIAYYHGQCRTLARKKYGSMTRYLQGLRKLSQKLETKTIKTIVEVKKLSLWSRFINWLKNFLKG